MRVAIIGAGPSGLVTAKSLLQVGICPRVFESSCQIGGIWSCSPTEKGKCWTSLHTNLSKFTCSFSDLPWPEQQETFPSFLDMNRYLQRYSDQFNLQSCITFQSKVTRVQACVPADLSEYKVEWMNTETKVLTTEIFDAVVVACGFFNEAIGSNASSSAECGLINSETSINSIHCSHYTSPAFCANKNVLVVGSSFSSTELTSELSFVAKNVYNLQTKPIYPLSRYLPLNPLHPASSRLPLDLLFCR